MMADSDEADGDDRFCLFAAAKVNLYLHVTGRRTDGYHTLDSLVAFAGVGDTITVSRDADISLEVSGPFGENVPFGADNLVIAAARGLAKATGCDKGAKIRLCKRLPVAAGIGGGSADAAATIIGLMRLWNVAIDDTGLIELALSLGADVPVCVGAKSAFVGGIGDKIEPTSPLPPAGLVLVNPMVLLATRDVFAAFGDGFSRAAPFKVPGDVTSLVAMLEDRDNDLSDAAISLAPQIGDALSQLRLLPGSMLARMSGSGATCFALFKDIHMARLAARELASSRPGWWVHATALLGNAD